MNHEPQKRFSIIALVVSVLLLISKADQPQLRIDFSYRSEHVTALAAKAIATASPT